MLKVLCVLGTRPEAVKLAPVILELARRKAEVVSRVCVTAQHREMLDQVLNVFGIHPDHDLNLMRPGQSLSQAAAAIFTRLEPVLRDENPDWVLVQGDTTTVAIGALAAFYSGARVGHVEAGLRSYDLRQPFPEEANRRVAGIVADLHFAPTTGARDNLLREGAPVDAVRVTGNTAIDAQRWAMAQPTPSATRELLARANRKRLIVVTAHRRENFGRGMEAICDALRDLAARYADDTTIIYPAHLNPNVQEPAHRLLDGVPNIIVVPPLDYLPMTHLLAAATLVLTDSGGIQEEAPGLGKPTLVMREKTERPEGIAAGTLKLVGADRARIVEAASALLEDPAEYARMARASNPYGDGHAAPRIVDAILERGR